MFPIFPIGAIVRKQKQIVSLFQTANATGPERATTSAKLGIHEGLAFRILLRRSILCDVGDQKLYLDESKWKSHRIKLIRLAFIIPTIVILGLSVLCGIVFLTHSQ